ncbi:hypothetical protein [Oleiharenicola lentus]|uniref:hypothetical protein n=1 Tax=Oleiharenicola lentus TaxID=2508720 RepID=UPI003F66E8D0
MKLFKTLAASLLAVACLNMASAATIKISGSSAFRRALFASVINHLGSGSVKALYVGSALNGANQVIFTNGTDTVQVCLAGSVGGVNWIVNNVNAATSIGGNTAQAWLSTTSNNGSATWATASVASTAPYAVTGGTSTTAVGSGTVAFEAAAAPTVVMSDSYQDSTAFSSSNTGVTLTDVSGGVGVVTFVWAKGTKHPSVAQASYDRLTNISSLLTQNLVANGIAPLAMFTGNDSDLGVDVVLVGRDNDSGTRLAAFAETVTGDVNTPAAQYRAFDASNVDVGPNSGAGSINSLALAAGVNGSGGYSSGGHVKAVLQKAILSTATNANGNRFILVGYLGTGDTPGAAQELTYNGVPNTVNGVLRGSNTFWTLQHMYYRSDLASGPAALADVIGQGMADTYAVASGTLLANMNVVRSVEGGVVNPIY